MIRVADYIANFIYDRLKVKEVFMVPGGGAMFLNDGVASHGKLRYVCTHHEQSAMIAAEGYARTNQNFGVAIVTSGPGATNAITGVVGAWLDSTPCMIISGQSKRSQTIMNSGLEGLRQYGVQEVNVIPIVKSITKYAVMVDSPGSIRYHLEKAAYLAKSARPGPVWLDIPLDVQGALIDPQKIEGFSPSEMEGRNIQGNVRVQVKEVISMLKNSRRPVIIAGNGVRLAGAVEKFVSLVKMLNIPVVTPRLGIDLMPTNHPLYIGRPGIKGCRAANFAVQNSDLLICLGTRLSVNITGYEFDKFAREAKIVVIDIDEVEHKKNTIKIDKFIHQDARVFIEAMLESIRSEKIKVFDEWVKLCQNWKKKYPVVLEEYRKQKPINTYYFTKKLSECLSSNDIIVIDSGTSSYVVSQSIEIKKGQRFIASGGLGSMGYALPASIGASFACGKNRVICITGDGSLQFNVQELATIAYHRLPIKIFIFNNSGYASIYATQRNFFNGRFIGVDKKSGLWFPDVLKLAKTYGLAGIRITNPQEVEKKIEKVLSIRGPVLCDIICSKEQLIIPTVSSYKREDGTMVSKPLEDMYPFLDRKEFLENMIVNPCEE